VRKLTGVKAHLDCPNPNLVPFYGKTAHVEPHHHTLHLFTIFSLDFFCNRICLLQQLHTTRKYAILVICCENFVVKSRVHATAV